MPCLINHVGSGFAWWCTQEKSNVSVSSIGSSKKDVKEINVNFKELKTTQTKFLVLKVKLLQPFERL